ncbi:GNAT family N-acetyltransferase [Amphiplicatus metriothermophilus]|uniref:Phosphinothricin acetyltransferase n=1 Tax=Amphiplicatus metriothermophilus TaxID=1519374 RepID=A0A239PT25_9PROT|nr:GNAT family N-acetyltransferase [Amphiplicatus metriothermophilus]MBB5519350.1 phosphinothricin acetyltransferase [Amphiplicatus metriothermophilus]SNT73451.1 phosphinothricin acetyltransferase [Amphiplicatus metriothermophilus]
MSGPVARRAIPADAAGINAVYNPYIRDTAATFELVEHDEAQRRRWIEERCADPRHPVFVAEDESGLCGFANAGPFDPRGAYATSVKVSVFVGFGRQGRGAGRALYEALFEALAATDVHRAYALIVPPNPASVALHERFGFVHVATLSEVGRKFGRYWDVMWFEKRF